MYYKMNLCTLKNSNKGAINYFIILFLVLESNDCGRPKKFFSVPASTEFVHTNSACSTCCSIGQVPIPFYKNVRCIVVVNLKIRVIQRQTLQSNLCGR